MPRTVSKISKPKKSTKGHHRKTRRSVKRHEIHHRPVPEQIGTAAGRLTEDVVTELVRPVARITGAPVPHIKAGARNWFFDAAAGITGGALAVGSVLIAAPIMFVAQAVSMSGEPKVKTNDLRRREYRDDAGQIHHHTRTFMRDHSGELRTLAA